jgi:hypothetical protein
MKEYCIKRKSAANWESVLKAESLETAALEFISSCDDIGAYDAILVSENKAWGKLESKTFIPCEIDPRPEAEWPESESKDLQADGTFSSSTIIKKQTIEGQHPEKFLDQIHEQSSYRALKGLIGAVTVFIIIALFAYLIVSIAIASDLRTGSAGMVIIGSMIYSGIGILVTIILKHLAFVLIDISDILIEQNRKK